MTVRQEWVGRYRRAGNTKAVFIPLELRQKLQELFNWTPGDYLLFSLHGGVLMCRRVDKSMLIDRSKP